MICWWALPTLRYILLPSPRHGRGVDSSEEKRELFIQDSQNAIRKAKLDGMREKAIAIARELLDVLDIETISQKTGLSITEIQDLT
jgi:hypothetical protein